MNRSAEEKPMHQRLVPSGTARVALRRFLATLYEPGDLVEIRPIEIWQDESGRRSRPLSGARQWLAPAEVLERSAQFAALNVSERANVFMGVNPRTRAGGGKKADVTACRAVWAELDRVSVAECRRRWQLLGLPQPTIEVASGGGVHLYWVLDEPLDVRASAVRDRFEAMLKALYRDLGADATSDVCRLLRLPGFWNMKDVRCGASPRPCLLVHCDGRLRYPLSMFARWQARARPRPTLELNDGAAAPTSDVRVERLVAAPDVQVRDRSGRDFAIVCELLRLGLSAKQIWPLVRTKSKFRTRGRQYFTRTVYNAAFYTSRLDELD